MSTLGVSRSGRVRKKSAKAVEMDGFDEGDDRQQRQQQQVQQTELGGATEANSRVLATNQAVVMARKSTPVKRPAPQMPLYNNNLNNQILMDNTTSDSSDSESDDSSDNDSDSDDLPLQKVSAQQMAQLQALQKGRRPKQTAPQRSRQYSSSTDYDPPYNPKTGAAKLSASSTPVQKSGGHRRPQLNTGLKILNSDLSSSNDDDSDDDSDSGDSLVIDGGDGFTKKAPLRKLKLPVATAAALANAQRQKMRQQQEEIDDDLSEENDDDDDDFVPSSAKRRRSTSTVPQKKPPPEKKPEPEPKKPKAPSAYVMYCTETRKTLLAENPALTFAELSKRMGHMWNILPEKDKQLWRRKAKTLQARNASGLISTGKPTTPAGNAASHHVKTVPEKKTPSKATPSPQQRNASRPTKSTIVNATISKQATQPARVSVGGQNLASARISTPSTTSNLSARISNYQDLLDKPVETPPRPFGHTPLDAAAHLKLLGESLTTIGTNLMAHQGPIAVSGSLSVLLDSTLCALGPLVCLTAQLDEMNGTRPETLKRILNNIAYIMPGL